MHRCESCEEVFQPGTRKIQYKSKQWHDSCFHCKVCKTKVGEYTVVWMFTELTSVKKKLFCLKVLILCLIHNLAFLRPLYVRWVKDTHCPLGLCVWIWGTIFCPPLPLQKQWCRWKQLESKFSNFCMTTVNLSSKVQIFIF